MPLSKKDIKNVFLIHFEDISKYLQYDDYYIFYSLYAPKNINLLKRKCLYCNNKPICPVNICYKRRNELIICQKSLLEPICYTCSIDNWMNNFNKMKYSNRLDTGYLCPYKCCTINNTTTKCNFLINRYNTDLINFSIRWKCFNKISYYKCKYCKIIFRDKYHYDIFKHYRQSHCKIVLNKLQGGLSNVNVNLLLYDSDSSSSSDEDEIL